MAALGTTPIIAAGAVSSQAASHLLPRCARVASSLLCLVGAAVLCGWTLDLTWLTRIHPAWPSMKVNTSLALLLAGAALGALRAPTPSPRQLRLGQALAAGVGLLGALSLVEHLLHVDLGIDQLLLDQLEPNAQFPGRMSAATALGLTLLALALAGLHAKPSWAAWAARLAALLVAVLGVLTVVTYWYGVKGLHGVTAFSTMALHTALLLVAGAAGVLCVSPERGPLHFMLGDGVGSRMARSLLPLAIVLPLGIGWLRLLGQNIGLYGLEFGLALFATTNAVSFAALIWATAFRLERSDKERRRAERERAAAVIEISRLNERLEQRVAARTEELEAANEALRVASEHLRHQKVDLERSVRDLEQFAYVASHDLQEPLRAVAGCAQILAQRHRGQLDARADELIAHIVEGAIRMRALLLDLLAFSGVGSSTVQPSRVDTGSELRAALARLEVAVAQASASLTNDVLPSVVAVPGQLTQVFENLVGNALKYRRAEPPCIHVTAQRRGADWQFSVSDNGLGIEAPYLERIFTIFQRLHTREQYTGTGIGLALCRKIVERHGGKIWVESALAQGSTFHFTIPSGDDA